MTLIAPGRSVGVLGNGQLGRMFGLAARTMGYRFVVYGPDAEGPASQIADQTIIGAYEDLDRVREFAGCVDVLSFEFENVPAATAAAAEALTRVRPGPRVLHTCQHRLREKAHLLSAGLPVAAFGAVQSAVEAESVAERVGMPGVLKTAASGYDGKGQAKVLQLEDAAPAFESLGGVECIYERFIEFEREVSVVAARGEDGRFAHYGLFENSHQNHILDLTRSPARVSSATARRAEEITRVVLESLEVVGVLCVEMFLTGDGELLVNELAPRPHNSGHLSIEAHETSQFEQQLRAVAGLPLGSTAPRAAAAMANLLGDLWANGSPRFADALREPAVHLHLYGKTGPKPGRKMGHLTALASTPDEAAEKVLKARESLVLPLSEIE